MKTAIIVYSETGHTLLVAEKILEEMKAQKLDVTLFRITSNEARNIVNDCPSIKGFDHLIIATHVQGFMPPVPMTMFIDQIASFSNVTFDIVLTQYFKWACLGGNNTVKRLSNQIISKGGAFKKSAIVHWSSKKREAQIIEAVNVIAKID